MKLEKSDRGFGYVEHETRLPRKTAMPILKESSHVGPYPDAIDRPGSSCLWVGSDHHLNREEVRELIDYLQGWLGTGKLVKAIGGSGL